MPQLAGPIRCERAKASLICCPIKNLRAAQLLPGSMGGFHRREAVPFVWGYPPDKGSFPSFDATRSWTARPW
jgi:hypothetical protein